MLVTTNTTLATLRNTTTTKASWQQGVQQNSSVATSAVWNVTEFNPYWNVTIWTSETSCPQCYPQFGDVSYAYTYIYYCLLLLLLAGAVVCIKLGLQRRNELILRADAQRRAALRAANTRGSNSNDNNCVQMGPKERDLPPAYDDIIPPSFIAKQSLPCSQDVTQGESTSATPAVANNIPAAISTLTIATDISSNFPSDVDLNSMTNSTAIEENTRSVTIAPPSVPDTIINITSGVKSNESIS